MSSLVNPAQAGAVTWEYIASANLHISNDTQYSFQGVTSYTKKKEIIFNEYVSGVLTVKFTYGGNGYSNEVYGRVYVNGVAFGTEQVHLNNTNEETESEDLTVALAPGDKLQLYVKEIAHPNAASIVKNFRIYYDKNLATIAGTDISAEAITADYTISTTNNDP